MNQCQINKEMIANDTVKKAKQHTQKVFSVLQSKKDKEVQDAKTKEQDLEQKLK